MQVQGDVGFRGLVVGIIIWKYDKGASNQGFWTQTTSVLLNHFEAESGRSQGGLRLEGRQKSLEAMRSETLCTPQNYLWYIGDTKM